MATPNAPLHASLVEPNSAFKGAIPALYTPIAVCMLVLNILFPGCGTFISGIICLVVGKPRFSANDTLENRIYSFLLNWLVSFLQTITVVLCFFGWGWSIWWGIIMFRTAKEYDRLRQNDRNTREVTLTDPEAQLQGIQLENFAQEAPHQEPQQVAQQNPHQTAQQGLQQVAQLQGPQQVNQHGPQQVSQQGPQQVTQHGLQQVDQQGPQQVTQQGSQKVAQQGPQPAAQQGPRLVAPGVPQQGPRPIDQQGPQWVPQQCPQRIYQLGPQRIYQLGPQRVPQQGTQQSAHKRQQPTA